MNRKLYNIQILTWQGIENYTGYLNQLADLIGYDYAALAHLVAIGGTKNMRIYQLEKTYKVEIRKTGEIIEDSIPKSQLLKKYNIKRLDIAKYKKSTLKYLVTEITQKPKKEIIGFQN